MSPPKNLPKVNFVLLGTLAFFWGIGWPIMKMALIEIGPWTFRSFCLLFGGLGVFAIAKANRSWSPNIVIRTSRLALQAESFS
jgi:drug/metabolite transporter (DMT)-like permease